MNGTEPSLMSPCLLWHHRKSLGDLTQCTFRLLSLLHAWSECQFTGLGVRLWLLWTFQELFADILLSDAGPLRPLWQGAAESLW